MIVPIEAHSLILATLVAVLFASGAYLLLRRGQIKLILGMALISHGVNLLLFGSGVLTPGRPSIYADKEGYLQEVVGMADPLPQALILTAIVISFGVTAFIVVLVSRRDSFTGSDVAPGEMARLLNTPDPFAGAEQSRDGLPVQAAEDYDLLRYELDEVYDHPEFTPLPDE